MKDMLKNNVLVTAIIAWAIAQFIKVVIAFWKNNKLDFTRITGAGGMPSSHSAFVTSLAIKSGIVEGYKSTEFAISAALAMVVMYDAAGVRREAGNQAKILNTIIAELNKNKGIKPERLKELIGHKPIEVIAGAILGITIGIIV